MATRLLDGRKKDDGALGQQVEALNGELDQLKNQLAGLNRSMGATGARLANASGFKPVASEPRETIEEEEVRVEKEAEAQREKESEYYGRLDGVVRSGASSNAEPRTQLRKNIDALTAAKIEPAPLQVGGFDCTDNLCRVEIQRLGQPAPNALAAALRHLTAAWPTSACAPSMAPTAASCMPRLSITSFRQ